MEPHYKMQFSIIAKTLLFFTPERVLPFCKEIQSVYTNIQGTEKKQFGKRDVGSCLQITLIASATFSVSGHFWSTSILYFEIPEMQRKKKNFTGMNNAFKKKTKKKTGLVRERKKKRRGTHDPLMSFVFRKIAGCSKTVLQLNERKKPSGISRKLRIEYILMTDVVWKERRRETRHFSELGITILKDESYWISFYCSLIKTSTQVSTFAVEKTSLGPK